MHSDATQLRGELSFDQWAAALVRLVLRSRTAFAHFLSTTLSLRWDDAYSVSTASKSLCPSCLSRMPLRSDKLPAVEGQGLQERQEGAPCGRDGIEFAPGWTLPLGLSWRTGASRFFCGIEALDPSDFTASRTVAQRPTDHVVVLLALPSIVLLDRGVGDLSLAILFLRKSLQQGREDQG